MEFDVFAKGDIGFHFGNETQAAARGNIQNKTGRTITAYLDIKNPINISTDIMSWRPRNLALKLLSDGIVTVDQYRNIVKMDSTDTYMYNDPAAVELRRILSEKGYDGIVYQNMFEGDGESYIAFYPEQVIIIDDGKGNVSSDIASTDTLAHPAPTAGKVLKMTPVSAKAKNYVKDIAKRLGTNLEFVDMAAELAKRGKDVEGLVIYPEGFYDPKTHTLYVGNDVVNPVEFVFKHELTHYGERSKYYAEFARAVRDSKAFKKWLDTQATYTAKDTAGKELQLHLILKERYEKVKNLTEPEAQKEVIANFVADVLFKGDVETLSEILNEATPTRKNAVMRFLSDFFSWLKSKFTGSKQIVSEIADLENMFRELIGDAAVNPMPTESGITYDTASEGAVNEKTTEDVGGRQLDMTKEQNATSYFGRTFKWSETGYLLRDGKKLDFSGKNQGAPGGYRTVDHRDIWDSYSEDEQDSMDGNEAMIDFMRRGNIRISPESDGINLSVMPTKEQFTALTEYITKANGEVILDIDNNNGDTVSSTAYPKGTKASKVIQDIKNYFEKGQEPQTSTTAEFHLQYSVPTVSKPDVAKLTETQYNNFGWVRANDVLTPAEYSALLSNYTGHKHKDDYFPITRFDETVLHSSQHNNVLMYVKGNIRSPQITKVVKINEDNAYILNKIKEELLKLERAQAVSPFSFVRDVFGEEILGVYRLRDYAPFQEYKGRRKGKFSEKNDTSNRNQQNRGRSSAEGSQTDRSDLTFSVPASEGEAVTSKSLFDKVQKGEITYEEFERLVNEGWSEAGKTYGVKPDGEMVTENNKPQNVPNKVAPGKTVRRFVRNVLEANYSKDFNNALKSETLAKNKGTVYEVQSNKDLAERARK